MQKLIFILGLSLMLQSCQPAADSTLRESITRIAGKSWSDRLLGEIVEEAPEVELPEIPQQTRNSTDVGTYNKPEKRTTEFERLPKEKQREFDYKFIEELFQVTRKTEAHDEDLVNWLNTLDQGGSREGIYQALVLDEVYAALENMTEEPSRNLSEFVLKFSQKYLKQTFTPEALNKLNLYSLKRILTEKSLDLMEYYETRNLDDLYRWYAVLSSDLGKNHEDYLANPIRSHPSALYHYAWAKEMPIQHIKSEVIVKLHLVMNGLQNK